jgi:hypothetical protein
MQSRANQMRVMALLLGGIAGFLAVGYAAFSGLIDSMLGDSTSHDGHSFWLGVIAVVGGVFARRRPLFCAGCEIVAGVGLLAQHNPILGGPMLAAAALAAVSIRVSPPAKSVDGEIRGDVGAALTAVGVLGLGVVAGAALLVLGLLVLVLALSGGSGSGDVSGLLLIPLVCGAAAVGLLVRRAQR